MKNKFLILMFSLLLAVGWTSNASAQRLPDKSPLEQYTATVAKTAQEKYVSDVESTNGPAAPSHSTTAAKKGQRRFGPFRAGQELDLKSITKQQADTWTYTWTDESTTPATTKTSAFSEVAKNPYQMYELLRNVYMDQRFPGPYYSAYTKDDVRERQVYYGAVDGGWDIPGATLSNTNATFFKPNETTSSVTRAPGSNTNTNLPVRGNYQDYGYRSQMIYTESMLGLQKGDIITSLTFYPTNGINFAGSTMLVTLGQTDADNFGTSSSSSVAQLSTSGMRTVAIITPEVNTSATTWTIKFNKPFIYEGGNLLVDIYCIGYSHEENGSGTYGSSTFTGQNQTNYQSLYVGGTSSATPSTDKTGTNSQFLPKAKFDYKRSTYQQTTYNPAIQFGDITISGTNSYAMINSIKVKSGNTTLFSWDISTDGTAATTGEWPYGMTLEYWGAYSDGSAITFDSDLHKITLDDWLFMGYSTLTVEISAANNQSTYAASLIVNGEAKNITTPYSSAQGTPETKTWTFNASDFTYPYTKYDPDYYKPTQEGYTALIVAVKNETSHPSSNSTYQGSFFTTKEEIVNYLAANVDSIQLLTDGIRIGKGSDYSIGTVFNNSGTYNKFFFLGKGQAKQKPDVIINKEIALKHAVGELVPFKCMFEQFSPTTGGQGDEITNFYSLMNEGNVYNVVHDCRDVINLGHQFSMSGNSETKAYAMTGMNFFIPDYRLKYWEDTWGGYTVDGRITNPYQVVSTDGNPAQHPNLMFRDPVLYSFWYAWYNQDYAPKVGLYKITLDAVATPVDYDYNEGNRNYAVTLTWVSSLNEMTGHDVPQIYTVWYWDPITGEKKHVEAIGITNGETGLTTITYLVEQKPHSYIIEYVVEGRPNDGNEHPQFVAVSNVAGVVIPGWEDFIGLELDHHESDFVVSDLANYYRNFLTVVNEDLANGLTISKITGADGGTPMNEFNLYRFEYDTDGVTHLNEKKIATLTLTNPTSEQVNYTVTYDDVNKQEQYEPSGENEDPDKYDLDPTHMDVPLTGVIRVKGNGDLVIWPNNFHLNFKSIVIKSNGVAIPGYSWNANTDTDLPAGWYMSTGSKWEEYVTTTTGDKVAYVEGGGYIYIPNMLNNSNYPNLTVEIVAYNDGAAVTRIAVNDVNKTITSTPGITYTWGTEIPISPSAAPRRDNNNNNSNN